jgi:cysteine desulfurase
VRVGERLYLDHNATTPVDPAVVAAMAPFDQDLFANPASVEHWDGHAAAEAVERAREQVAAVVGARPAEIVFTASCTEANNLAILGAARAATGPGHLVTTQIEHPSVLEPFRMLEQEGWRVTCVAVGEDGRVDPDAIGRAITPDTLLVSVMAANNEVGVVQPIAEIGAICANRGVMFHSDLAQVLAYEAVDVGHWGLHMASLSAHKAYGPKGIGALYVRSRRPRARLAPILFGGGQERGLRPGTLNTPAIVGFGAAAVLAQDRATTEAARLRRLSEALCAKVLAEIPGAVLNGHPTARLANALSFSIAGIEPLALIHRLRGEMSFSASSACSTEKIETSHVLKAMFGESPRAKGAFRIAAGRFTTQADVERAGDLLVAEANRLLRRAAPAA